MYQNLLTVKREILSRETSTKLSNDATIFWKENLVTTAVFDAPTFLGQHNYVAASGTQRQ